jgi:hypothetical protein
MKKNILIIISIFILIIGLLFAVPFFYKGTIVQIVKEQANKNINASINFDNDIELSLLKNFPDFTLGINNIIIMGVEDFDGDTLIALKTLSATLDIMSVIKGEQIKVINVLLDKPIINAIIHKNGKANWDITKPNSDSLSNFTTDTTESKYSIALKRFEIKHARIVYDDKSSNMSAQLTDFNQILIGDFSQDNFLLNLVMNCSKLTYTMDGISYLNKVKLDINADINANMKELKFTFKENKIKLNELSFGFDGWVAIPSNDIEMDITYSAKESEFKQFLSLIPAIYTKDFASIKTSGKLSFNGFAKGIYNEKSLPAFALNLAIENAQFQYPELPAPVANIQVKFAATNPDGNIDNTKVELSKLHFEIMGDPFDIRFIATNITKDPNIDASCKGLLNFDNILKIMPLEDGMKIAGKMTVDITAKGKISTIEKEQYEQVDAKGNIGIYNFIFVSKDIPKPYYINQANLTFNPKSVSLTKFDAKIGNSDMQMTGELSNFFAYTFGKGTLKGLLNFTSEKIDANEFLTKEENPTQSNTIDTAGFSAPELPDNIDFTLNATINKLLYTNLSIENFGGQIKITNAKLAFNNIVLNTIGSQIKMDGFYETSNPKKPTMDMSFAFNNMEFKKAFMTFNTIKKIAPIAENITGSFSTSFKMKTIMDQQLNSIYESLYATGSINILQAGFNDVKLFNKAAEVLKYSKLKDPTLNNVNIQFEVKNGRIYTEPFEMKVAGQKLLLSGSTGLDQTVNYIGKIAIPRTVLGNNNDILNNLLAQANTKAATNVKVSDIITVNLGLGGTFTNPSVSTNLNDIAKNEANSVKDQLLNEFDKKRKDLEDKTKVEAIILKNEAETKARAEADKIKNQAQVEANQAQAKAQAEADKLKKEAEVKSNAEKERLKKLAEEEAKKKLKGIFGK